MEWADLANDVLVVLVVVTLMMLSGIRKRRLEWLPPERRSRSRWRRTRRLRLATREPQKEANDASGRAHDT